MIQSGDGWAGSAVCLGTNVFGWTIDESASHEILDRYCELGGDFIDTADNYSVWAEGNPGGVSESVIGGWLARRGRRDDVVIATKLGQMPDFTIYSDEVVRDSVSASLTRLGVDHVDILYAHRDYESRPLAEVARAFHNLVVEGKVRRIGLSNYRPERVSEWLAACDAEGLTRPRFLQPHYNLMERQDVENGLAELAVAEGLHIVSYAGLARGFLTGRYRSGRTDGSPRAYQAEAYAGELGDRVLAALDTISSHHGTTPAQVALAWVLAKPGITSTIASVSRAEQLEDVMASARLTLDADEVEALDRASAK